MYKVGDKVIYNGLIYNITVVGDVGWYLIKDTTGEATFHVHEKYFIPYFKLGDKVSLNEELKGFLLKQHFSNVDTNYMEVLANYNGAVLIKGVGIYCPSFIFKYASKPRQNIHVSYKHLTLPKKTIV